MSLTGNSHPFVNVALVSLVRHHSKPSGEPPRFSKSSWYLESSLQAVTFLKKNVLKFLRMLRSAILIKTVPLFPNILNLYIIIIHF